jgi:hypothetical protein
MFLTIHHKCDVFFHEVVAKIFDEMRGVWNDEARLFVDGDAR